MTSNITKAVRLSDFNTLHSHTVLYLRSTAYYVRNRVEWKFPSEVNTGGITIPAVVFNANTSALTPETLTGILEDFREDDVFQEGFTKNAVLVAQAKSPGCGEPTNNLSDALTALLDSWSSTLLFISPEDEGIPQGPYFLRGQTLHRAWRLYPDESRAFTSAVMPADESDDNHSFQPLHAAAYSGLYPVVAVPSRLYTPPSATKPLNGLRVSIKDIFHLKGLHTTAGSRSYTRLYGPQSVTCEVVRRMINQGAVVVGKTKLGAYAESEVPPEKTIDYFASWNPRGDGYQGPSGSSSGAGSSIASYPWLDLALGTDSTGSIRMPAASYGLWGLRASWNAFPMSGILPNVDAFDTLGLLSRSPGVLQKMLDFVATEGTISNARGNSSETRPVEASGLKLIYPTDWFPMNDQSQQKMVEIFSSSLEEELQIPTERISLERRWSETAPEELRSVTLPQYLDKSIYWPNYYDGFHSWDEFRADYRNEFQEPPYASPFMTKKWELCKDVSKEQRNQGLAELKVYQQWVLDHVMNADSHRNVMLLPLGRAGANYRDVVPPPGGEFSSSAYSAMFFATVLGLPQVVVPIGQTPYTSRVTEKTEYAPIVGSIVGARGSDKILLKLAEKAIEKHGWPAEVATGPCSFRVGDNDRHVEPTSKI